MKATNGNIHLMETMAILNCLPEITSKEGIIGNILVANPHSLQGTAASNEELVYNFGELVSHIDGFQNNIKNIKFANKVELAKISLEKYQNLVLAHTGKRISISLQESIRIYIHSWMKQSLLMTEEIFLENWRQLGKIRRA